MKVKRINGSKVYLNSFVENAEQYFLDNMRPSEVQILDASFDRNGEYLNVVEGLGDYINGNQENLNRAEKEHVKRKYSNITLNLVLKDLNETSPNKRIFGVSIANIEENIDILYQTGKETQDLDSCLHLINRHAFVYRQAVNGKDIIGISKYYKEPKKK